MRVDKVPAEDADVVGGERRALYVDLYSYLLRHGQGCMNAELWTAESRQTWCGPAFGLERFAETPTRGQSFRDYSGLYKRATQVQSVCTWQRRGSVTILHRSYRANDRWLKPKYRLLIAAYSPSILSTSSSSSPSSVSTVPTRLRPLPPPRAPLVLFALGVASSSLCPSLTVDRPSSSSSSSLTTSVISVGASLTPRRARRFLGEPAALASSRSSLWVSAALPSSRRAKGSSTHTASMKSTKSFTSCLASSSVPKASMSKPSSSAMYFFCRLTSNLFSAFFETESESGHFWGQQMFDICRYSQ